MREPLLLCANDTVEVRKPHPCGNRLFRITHAGADVRLCCLGCGHYMTFDRLKAEKIIRKVTVHETQHENQH